MDFTARSAVMSLNDTLANMSLGAADIPATYVPLGSAQITSGLPLLRCLSGNPDAATPDDVPACIMPRWAAWVICTIGDNLDQPGLARLMTVLSNALSEGITEGQWRLFQHDILREWGRVFEATVSPFFALTGKAGSRQSDVFVKSIEALYDFEDHVAVPRIMNALGIDASLLFDDIALAPLMYADPATSPQFGNINVMMYAPIRFAIWVARAKMGDSNAFRRGLLDLDFSTLLFSSVLIAAGISQPVIDVWSPLSDAVCTSLLKDF